MRSKTYNVKSNAARAAQKYGITRDQLISVSGGWCFNVPAEMAPQSTTEPAGEAIQAPDEPAWQPDEPIEWAGTDYMVVNGELPKDEPETIAEPDTTEPAKTRRAGARPR
jgi:hypothetical protein